MIISMASDHGGLTLKNQLKDYLVSQGYEVIDNGTYTSDSCDYPIYGKLTAKDVQSGKAEYGILVCTSGEGISITANKFKGIRCAIGYNDEVARLCRAHNNANIIAFGQSFTTFEEAKNRVEIFLKTPFEGGRHERRVKEIED